MPIYEYRCDLCGFQKEFLQKMNDAMLTTCPACNKETLSKMLSAAGFQLKGSGWYASDFKGGKKPPEEKSTTEPTATDKAPAESAPKEKTATSHACGSGACGTCS